MEDLTQFDGETNDEYIQRLKKSATPFGARPVKEEVLKDDLTAVFNLSHMQVGEAPQDYSFRGGISLDTKGVEPYESPRRAKVKFGQRLQLPNTLEEGIPRGLMKIENNTGKRRLGNPSDEEKEQTAQQVVLLVSGDDRVLEIIRPGRFYFGEPPQGDLFLVCPSVEAVVSFVIFPGIA